MEMISRTQPKANKNHSCDWCFGTIHKGEVYELQKIATDEGILTWKNHISCGQIATDMDMFDYCDEGLTAEDFQENIQNKYMDIMSEFHNDYYESPEFEYPDFEDQLIAVKLHYKITP